MRHPRIRRRRSKKRLVRLAGITGLLEHVVDGQDLLLSAVAALLATEEKRALLFSLHQFTAHRTNSQPHRS